MPGFTAMVLIATHTEPSCSITMPGRISLPLILATGRVKVFVRNRSGWDVAIDELGEGAFFGEMAAISSRSRAATVTAASACTLLELDGPALRSILQSYPAVRDVLEHVFIERANDPHAASVRSLEGR